MRKLLLAVTLIAMTLLAGCCDHEDSYPLDGTTWISAQAGPEHGGWSEMITINFYERSFQERYIYVDGYENENTTALGDYRFNDPYITITYSDGWAYEGIIAGDYLEINYAEAGEEDRIVTYVRQY